MRKSSSAFPLILAPLAAAALAWGLNMLLFPVPMSRWALLAASCLALGLYALSFRLRKIPAGDAAVPLILAASFLTMLLFVLQTPYDFSSHDLSAAGSLAAPREDAGHIWYAVSFLRDWLFPLSVNPLESPHTIFYNPPFFYLLEGVFLKGNLLLGIPWDMALENLQTVSLFFAFQCVVLIYRILREFALPQRSLILGLLAAAFQPALLIFSGTLTNDIASVCLVLAALLYTAKWYRKQSLRHIAAIALCLGLAMATKLSAALAALPVGLVLAFRFFQNLKSWKAFLGQFALFLLISIPLGTAWPLFHAIRWNMPLNFIPEPPRFLYAGMLSGAARYLPFDWGVLRSGPYFSLDVPANANLWVQTLRTAVFDELSSFPDRPGMLLLSYGMLALFAAMAALAVFALARMLFAKGPRPYPRLLLCSFLAYGAALLASYAVFYRRYPYICTLNFRYIMPLLLLLALGVARAARGTGPLARVTQVAVVAFAAASCFVYASALAFP